MRRGQISIDYMGGALLFFASMLFVIAGLLGAVPQFSQQMNQNELELRAWGVSTLLTSSPGYWENSSGSGTDWYRADGPDVRQVGLTDGDGELVREKLQGLVDTAYEQIRLTLRTELDFNVEFTEYLVVDTYASFNRSGGLPGPLQGRFGEPDTPLYAEAGEQVHYGAAGPLKFLVTSHNGTFDTVYTSESWNFSGAQPLLLDSNAVVPVGERRFRFVGASSGVARSSGRKVVLRRLLGRAGIRKPAGVEDSVSVRRFGSMDGNPVSMRLEVWER